MTNAPQTPEEPWTMLRALNWTAAYFRSNGIDSPRVAAEILLAYALGLRRIDLYVRYDQPLLTEELGRYKTLIRRRAAREPTAYITEEREFWSLPIRVTPAVLIPRPETECLVEAALAVIDKGKPLRMWEPGTGSGAVSIALARERPRCRLFASDRSPAALAVARQNAARHEVAERIALFAADWTDPVSVKNRPLDAIVCNPPYIPGADIEGLAPEIARFEPRRALDGGPDGLSALRRLIREAPAHLKPGGTLLLEIGYDQGPAVCGIADRCRDYETPEIIKDYGGNPRVLRIRRR